MSERIPECPLFPHLSLNKYMSMQLGKRKKNSNKGVELKSRNISVIFGMTDGCYFTKLKTGQIKLI